MESSKPTPYHFDLLPVHPRLQRLETHTSFLLRLSESNQISDQQGLKRVLFPGEAEIKKIHASDSRPRLFGALPTISMCSQESLLQSTFYHVPRKFGIIDPYVTNRSWMKTVLALHLRFCPYCLQQDPYYKLSWRFLTLLGCAKHKCQLVNSCSYCGIKNPIFPEQLRMGICPTCKKDLCSFQAPPLSLDDCNTLIVHERDLEMLLSPHEIESTPVIRHAGSAIFAFHYRWMRKQIRESRDVVARCTGITEKDILLIESRAGYGVSIRNYILLARYYNISLCDMFDEIQKKVSRIDMSVSSMESGVNILALLSQLREEYYFSEFKDMMEEIDLDNDYIEKSSIAKNIGISSEHMSRIPKIQTFFRKGINTNKRNAKDYKDSREKFWLETTKDSIKTLQDQNKPVTLRNICRIMGTKRKTLYSYPTVKALLELKVDTLRINIPLRHSKREVDLVKQTQEVLSLLEQRGERVTQRAVAEQIGLCVESLYPYPAVIALIRQEKMRRKNGTSNSSEKNIDIKENIVHENKCFDSLPFYEIHNNQVIQESETLLDKVRNAIQSIREKGKKVTVAEITRITGVLDKKLYQDSQVKEILDQEVESSNYQVRVNKEKFEMMVVRQVEAAIKTLRNSGQLVTKKAIMETIPISREMLHKYDSVREILECELDTSLVKRQQRNQYKTGMLINQIGQTIQKLKSQNKKVTIQAISEQVGVSKDTLRHNTQIRKFLEHQLGTSCFKDQEKQQQRDRENLALVRDAIEQLQDEKRSITWNAISQVSGVTCENLKINSEIRILVSEFIEAQDEHTQIYRSVNEGELYDAVQQAIDQLKAEGKKITIKAICTIVDRNKNTLRYYPQVWALLEQHVSTLNDQLRKKSTTEELG